MSEHALPLFPLHTVLFPGARLQLRIFEPRYLDLVRQCARDGSGFGVCLILEGQEAGEPAAPVATGTEARIVDFNTLPDGLLGITALGGRRFRVLRTRVRDNGLVVADVGWLDEPAPVPLAIEYELLATLLRRLVEHMGGIHARVDDSAYADAGWVSWRLAELLPIAPADRQLLLQECDPDARLRCLLDLVAQLQPE
ncbi:MAG TPA: LON peptidase substrate-binding domain-containing protein [Xanthomonadaceae bacterium]|jgi:Lon protease-like protein|nr:LON peptidase substrate-binding domain-containing protein [Xanthomonadaceae bacterium]